MAQNMVSPVATVSFSDPARSTGPSPDVSDIGIVHRLLSHGDMDAVLLAAPLSLSQSRVDSMTLNDKQFFIREAIRVGDVTVLQLLPPLVSEDVAPSDEIHPYGTIWQDTVTGNIYQTPGNGDWLQVI